MATVVLGTKQHMNVRHYFRRHFVEEAEWFGPAPEGDYDVAEFLNTLPAPFQNPSLLLAFFEFGLHSNPVNLAAVKCPKVLLINDSHHYIQPLTNALDYTRTESYDLILGQFVRQHLHFFREAGFSNTIWLPSFTLHPYEMQPGPKIRPTLFIGGVNLHPYRNYIFNTLAGRGVDLPVGTAGPDYAALEYNRTQINLNISMNGDLNLRNFEVLASHGFLITDRLSPESGFDLLFQDRRHLVLFDSVEHLAQLVTYYLAHPQEADAIAAQGHAHYLRYHTPARKIQQLHEALAGKIVPEYSLDLEPRTKLPPEPGPRLSQRVRLYERLQEIHRCNPLLPVLFWEGLEREAIDAVDLPRARSLLARPGASAVDACGLQARIERLAPAPASVHGRAWPMAVLPPTALNDPRLHLLIQRQAISYFLVPHYDAETHAALQALIDKYQLNHHAASDPPLLSLHHVPLTFSPQPTDTARRFATP